MKNRDYWSRPIQSDRMLSDYGNSGLRFDGQPKRGTIRRFLAGTVLFILGCWLVVMTVAVLSTGR